MEWGLFALRRCLVNAPLPTRSSRINYWFGRILIEPFGRHLYGRMANNLRQQLGMQPQTGRENIALRRNMPILYAFSSHVVPPAADYPPNVHTTGYWFLDEQVDWQPPDALRHFLSDGPPPVYIGFGSMTGRDPAGLTQLIIQAVKKE